MITSVSFVFPSILHASAVIVNSALKKKAVKSEDATLLDECIQIMIKCCDVIIAKLSKKK